MSIAIATTSHRIPAIVDGELGHHHNTNIVRANVGFFQQL